MSGDPMGVQYLGMSNMLVGMIDEGVILDADIELLHVNFIEGLDITTSLSFLGSTVTSTNTIYLGAMDQDVGTSGNPSFATLRTNAIDGALTITELDFLGSTVTSTNTTYLALMNQDVAVNAAPRFLGILFYDSVGAHGIMGLAGPLPTGNRAFTLPIISVDDVFVMELHTQTLTNKTLAAPKISGDVTFDETTNDLVLAVADQTVSSPTLTVPNLTGTSQQVVCTEVAQDVKNKTLWDPTIQGDMVFSTPIYPLTLEVTPQNTAAPTLTVIDMGGVNGDIVINNATQILTNKAIDSTNNTITNIVNANISTSAGIDVNKTNSLYRDSDLNVAFGSGAFGSGGTNLRNTAVGYLAMASLANTQWSQAFGYGCMQSANNADFSSCFGYTAGQVLQSGHNTLFGYRCGRLLSTSSPDNAIGGNQSADNATTNFTRNTGWGKFCFWLCAATIGCNNNVCIGYKAGALLSTATSSAQNVIVGSETYGADGINNSINIGYNITTFASNQVRLGNGSVTSFVIGSTSLNTAGIVVSNGAGSGNNALSSVTTVTPNITFANGVTYAGDANQSALNIYEAYSESNTYTSNLWSAAINITLKLTRTGNLVSCLFPSCDSLTNGSANDQIALGTAIPSRFRPAIDLFFPVRCDNAGTYQLGLLALLSTGNITISSSMAAAVFTRDGVNNSGLVPIQLTWTTA